MCIGVDDVGLHRDINEAAAVLIEGARVHAVSCMVGGPAWPAGARRLRALGAQDVDVGLHLDLTEAPLTLPRRRLGALIAAGALHALDRRAIRREIEAQLGAFEDAIGRVPAHVDGHQHVHQFAVVRDELLDALQQRYGDELPWLRRARRPARASVAPAKAWVIERLGARALAVLAAARGFRQNAHLLGVYGFRGSGEHYGRLVRAWLAVAEDTDLLVCHASVCAIAGDPLGAARRREFEVLQSSRFELYLRQQGIVLMPMSQCLAARSPMPLR